MSFAMNRQGLLQRKSLRPSLYVAIGVVISLGAQFSPELAAQDLTEYVRKNASRQSYGMYLNDQKLGWVIEEMRLGEFKGQPAAIYEDESLFSTVFFGETEESTSKSKVVYSLEGDGNIIYAESIYVEDGKSTKIVAEPDGEGMRVVTTIGEATSVREVPTPKDNLLDSIAFDEWLQGERKTGDRTQTFMADFEEVDIDVIEEYKYVGQRDVVFRDEEMTVIDLEVNVMGGEGRMTLSSDGDLIEGMMGGLIRLVAEDESTVKNMSGDLVDLFEAASIRLDKDLGDPELVTRLVLEIEGHGDFKFPNSPRQQVTKNDDGSLHIELTRDRHLDQAAPLSDAERKKYLESTPSLLCDHPTIVERAKRIIRDETDSMVKAERIMRWVYRNLDAAAAANATTSIQVLDQRAGDCTEHSLLCVAFARAVGIPAREVSGVMYGGEGTNLFAWHAWVEIHNGEEWIAIDPTWNQMKVDATHLTFSTETTDLSWTNVVGQLKVKVIEFEKE